MLNITLLKYCVILMMTNKEIFDYKVIINKLNNIFLNVDENIRKHIEADLKIKTRKTKISFLDTLIYSILHTQIRKFKSEIVSQLDYYNKNLKINRTTLYEKEVKIPISFYLDIFKKISKVHTDYFSDNEIKKLVAVDGTYNNTNVYNLKGMLETSLNMGLFDINSEIPIDLTFNGIDKKNNELKLLINYINENKEKFSNVILILDRAYCSYKFIDFLNKKNINYVCRFRNNCKKLNEIKNKRIIKFTNYSYETVNNKKIDYHLIKNKKFESVVIEIKEEYTLITNLKNNEYNDEKIKNIYHKRWDIEVFF